MQTDNLLGQQGLNINVGIDNNDVLLLGGVVFLALVLALVVSHLITRSI